MKNKNFFFLSGLLICIGSIYGQSAITRTYNSLRPDDKLIKQQVVYKDIGRSGENVFWDFSNQKPANPHYELSYSGREDSITGHEHHTHYSYILKGDSLFCNGYENPTTMFVYQKPELLICYPFPYLRQTKNYFYGSGCYGHTIYYRTLGKSTISSDAFGMMVLPSGDTLSHVTRIHQRKDIVEQMLPNRIDLRADSFSILPDSMDVQFNKCSKKTGIDIYRWYADGYRYPVFETIELASYQDGQICEHANTAFIYTPEEQYYELANDPDNLSKRESIILKQNQESFRKQNETNFSKEELASGGDLSNFYYNLFIADDGNTIHLDYALSAEANISIMLFDLQGRLLEKHCKGLQKAGVYRDEMVSGNAYSGELLLRIEVGSKIYGTKLFNRK